ncbi:MAG: GWxTD domain-containing protein [Bacteroidota bacterium]
MNSKLTLFVAIIYSMLLNYQLKAQNKIANVDFNHQFRMNGLRSDVICIKNDTAAYLLVQFSAPFDSIKNYNLSYSLVNSTGEEIKKYYKLNRLSQYFQSENKYGSQFGVPIKLDDHKYIAFWLSDTITKTIYPYVTETNKVQRGNGIALISGGLNMTIFEHYREVGSTVRINGHVSVEDSVLIDFYDYHFLPAPPPMSQRKDSLRVPFKKDESTIIGIADSFKLEQEGLFYLHFPGMKYGHAILSRQRFYPKFTSIDKLVESLRYIATEDEYNKMTTSFQKKDLFDEFWLNNTKSPEKAKEAIMEYYKRIKEANCLFTTYKEGWKSDMGMIYIIFGAPSHVYYNDNGVMWVYNKTFELPRFAFFFNRVELGLLGQEYKLERKLEFEKLWFRTVSLWRTGKKEY